MSGSKNPSSAVDQKKTKKKQRNEGWGLRVKKCNQHFRKETISISTDTYNESSLENNFIFVDIVMSGLWSLK